MANRKISDLTALTAPVTGDLLPIVDISEAAAADKNKKITYGTFLSSVPLGTAAAPSIAFTGDINTGIYSPGADQLAISTGGTSRLAVSTTAVSSTLAVDVPLGAVGTPSLTFTGDLNTGIYSPGADQVGISTGGTGRLFVDSAGRVGVNKTPGTNAGLNQRLQIKQTGDVYDGLQIEKFDDDSILGIGVYNGVWTFNATYNGNGSYLPIRFFTNSHERIRIDTSGRLLVGLTSANTSGAKLQTSDGLTFPATHVASADPNTLDDYEEGTWTPALGDSTDGVATMSTQEGKYVKVGKIVQFSLQIVWTAKNTWTGSNVRISGLPFTATSNTGAYYWPTAVTMSCNLTTTAFNYAIEATTTRGYVMDLLGNQIDSNNWPSSGRAVANGVYQTA